MCQINMYLALQYVVSSPECGIPLLSLSVIVIGKEINTKTKYECCFTFFFKILKEDSIDIKHDV